MRPWIKLFLNLRKTMKSRMVEGFVCHIYAAFCARGLPVTVSV